MMQKYRSYVLPALFIILVVLSLIIIRPFITAIILGALLAYVTHPLYKFSYRKTRWPNISALMVCIFVLLILVVPSIFMGKALVNQSYTAVTTIREQISFSATMFDNCHYNFCTSLQQLLQNPSIVAQVQEAIQGFNSKVIERGSEILLSIPRFVLNLFVMFFTLFFFLRDGRTFLDQIQEYLSLQKEEYSHLLNRLQGIIHGVVFGYLMVALIQGALGALGFFIFGVSSPIFWGMIMALLALIPVLGTGVIWVPASLFLFFQGIIQSSNSLTFRGIGLFLYGLILISTIDNILKPKLIGDKAGVHSIIVMVGIFGGLIVIGPLGVILGPLILSFTSVLVQTYFGKKALTEKIKKVKQK